MDFLPPRTLASRLAYLALVAFTLLLVSPVTVVASDEALVVSPAQVFASEDTGGIDLVSNGKRWSIELEEKTLLGSMSGVQQALYDIPVFYEGSVDDQQGSWVRLMLSTSGAATQSPGNDDAVLTGHVYVDETLYELQHRSNEGGYFLATLGEAGLAPLSVPASANLPTLTGRASTRANVSAPKAIKIGIVIDSQYNEHFNKRGLAHALGIINGVDGLYQSQLGLALIVETFRVYDNPAEDPLTDYSGTVEQVLDHYREIRFNDDELPADLALVHLFSGHQDPQKVIGLGWIDTVCRNDGYDLSMSTPFTYDILLSAHEIAHNLGAVHDDDAYCAADSSITGSEIMWLELSGDTQPQFSACSLDNMRSSLEASCVIDNIDVGIQLSARPSGLGDSQQEVAISVANLDDSRQARQVRTTTRFPAGTVFGNAPAGCTVAGTTLSCLHGDVPATSYSTLSVNAGFNNSQNPVLTSELTFDEFIDTQHLDNRASLQVSDNQATASGQNNPTVSFAETDMGQRAMVAPVNDEIQSGGSAGTGSTRLLELMLLAITGILLRLFRGSLLRLHLPSSICDPCLPGQTGIQKLRSTE